MRLRSTCLAAVLVACAATPLRAVERTVLHELAVGESAAVRGLLPATAKGAQQPLLLRRVSVYADDAELVWMDQGKARPAPRSERRWFAGAGPGPHDRALLALDPSDGRIRGARFDDDGGEAIEGRLVGDRLLVASRRPIAGLSGRFQCGGSPLAPVAGPGSRQPEAGPGKRASADVSAGAKGGGALVATLAVDTDTELLQLKFGGNPSAASAWIADLVAMINVIYARDLGFEFRIGKLVLRSGSDPWTTPVGASVTDQLYEFGQHWRLNESATPRAYATLISGKASSANRSSGIAWVLESGSWCAATGSVQGGGVTAGHFSVTQVFRSPDSPPSQNVFLVGHELGHTAGVRHTHCTDRVPGGGLQPLDRCWNGEAGNACYSGTPECPDESVDTDIGSRRGTLMSYCHLGAPSGASCGSALQEFHPAHEVLLAARVATNVTAGCLVFEGGVAPEDIVFDNGFEDPS